MCPLVQLASHAPPPAAAVPLLMPGLPCFAVCCPLSAVVENLLSKEDLVSMDRGCVCCSLRNDIVGALRELQVRAGRPAIARACCCPVAPACSASSCLVLRCC